MADDNFLELARKRTPRPGTWGRRGPAGKRYVRTPEGAEKYGLPIGALITADAIRRAQARGRSYSVPEDSGDFGSKPPAAGRTRKDASELVSAIRNAPAPRRTNPEGPKKVAVGRAGFGFPEGSRTFRPKDHENFAIVRTPDYQLVVVTDKGIAFELDGELEKELNEELDDNASENFITEDPDFDLEDVDGDGDTGDAEALGDRPGRVEDAPGFLNEDRIQDILQGMEQAGLDQNARDMTELQLRRSNDRIRREFENAEVPAPDDQQQVNPATQERGDATQVRDLVAEIDRDAQEAVAQGFAETDETVPAEKPAPGQRQKQPAQQNPARQKPQNREEPPLQPNRQGNKPDAEQRNPDEQLRDLEELAKGRSSGVSEGTVGAVEVSVRRNRVNGEVEYFADNEALDRAAILQRVIERPQEPRDTSDLDVGELTDEELANLKQDLDDFLATRDLPPRRVLRRQREVVDELARRGGDDNDPQDESENEVEAAEKPATKQIPEGKAGDENYDDYAESADIQNARPGDAFVVRHEPTGVDRTYVVGDDGKVYPRAGGFGIDREGFQDWLHSDEYRVWANKDNRNNKAPRHAAQPGDPATSAWAKEAKEGAVAYSPDGVLAERNADGSWNTPIGKVNDNFFDAGDVENDLPDAVVRTNADVENRPAGATNRLESKEDLDEVRSGDAVVFVREDGTPLAHATKRSDNTISVKTDSGLSFEVPLDEDAISREDIQVWHVPNQNNSGEPSKKSWSKGDRIQKPEDLNALPVGASVRAPDDAREFVISPDGRVRATNWPEGNSVPASYLNEKSRSGRMEVVNVPEKKLSQAELNDLRDAMVPRVVENLNDYRMGDTISDYHHLQEMKAGDQVTLIVPASENGGRELFIPMRRTDDESAYGGYMFLVGDGGRGYNSFGENNENLYQAIHDGRLLFGNVYQDLGQFQERIVGNWDTEKNIELWEGGPKVSEADLSQYVASQMSARAMQLGYFDKNLLPDNNPFWNQDLRNEFGERAKKKYSKPGEPMRVKPASIRLASELLGVEFKDPESAIQPRNLSNDDFRNKIDIGEWYRGGANEKNMGPEKITVTVADLKKALVILDNMQDPEEGEDPDRILKRVFARHGSPLQNMNTSVAIAGYYGVVRYRQNDQGEWVRLNTIGRQNDKRKNKELFRQMLVEQLEGREPGYYGLPEDEEFLNNKGEKRLNRTTLTRPEINADNEAGTPEGTPEPTPSQQLRQFQDNLAAAKAERMQRFRERIADSEEMAALIRADIEAAAWNGRISEDDETELLDLLNARKLAEEQERNERAFRDIIRNAHDKDRLDDIEANFEGMAAQDKFNSVDAARIRELIRSKREELREPTPAPPTPVVETPAPVDEPQAWKNIGDSVLGTDLAAAPVGSVVGYRRKSGNVTAYVKREDGWYSQKGNRPVPIEEWNDGQRNFDVIYVPGQALPKAESEVQGTPDAPEEPKANLPKELRGVKPGDRMYAKQLRALPNGAVVRYGRRNFELEDGYLLQPGGRKIPLERNIRRHFYLVELPNSEAMRERNARQAAEAERIRNLPSPAELDADQLAAAAKNVPFKNTSAADVTPEAMQALKDHFDAGGEISTAPNAGLWNFIQVRSDLFEVKQLSKPARNISSIWSVRDKRSGKRFVAKDQEGAQAQAIYNDAAGLAMLQYLGIQDVGGYLGAQAKSAPDSSHVIIMDDFAQKIGAEGRRVDGLVYDGDAIARGPAPEVPAQLVLLDYFFANEHDRHGNNMMGVNLPGNRQHMALLDYGLALGNRKLRWGELAADVPFKEYFRKSRDGMKDRIPLIMRSIYKSNPELMHQALQREITQILGVDMEGFRERLRAMGFDDAYIDKVLETLNGRLSRMKESGFLDEVVTEIANRW